jgi:hypothetical protein
MNTHILPLLCVLFVVCFLCFVITVYNLLLSICFSSVSRSLSKVQAQLKGHMFQIHPSNSNIGTKIEIYDLSTVETSGPGSLNTLHIYYDVVTRLAEIDRGRKRTYRSFVTRVSQLKILAFLSYWYRKKRLQMHS